MKTLQKFTVFHRLLHWIIATVMVILFVTGFLRMYWMSKKTIINAVETEIQKQNLDFSFDKTQITDIVKSIQKPMWEWHEYAAYIIFFVFFARIIYMFAKGIKFPNPFEKNQPAKERMQGFIYVLFYLFLISSIVTGAYLKWGNGGELKEQMEAIHKWAIYWFPVFILLHFGGIAIAELTSKKGITSRMIGGDFR